MNRSLGKLIILAIVAVACGALFFFYRDQLTIDQLVQYEDQLKNYRQQQPLLVYALSFSIYSLATGASLPGAALMTLFCGWYFGFLRAMVLVSFASTTGATLAFLVSRYFLKSALQLKFQSKLESFDQALKSEGPFYLFTLRLIPAVPFFVINLVMGLTSIRTFTFWWVSQLGMLPGTVVFVYAGSQFPDLKQLAKQGAAGILTPGLIGAFVVLGLFPIMVRKLMQRYR